MTTDNPMQDANERRAFADEMAERAEIDAECALNGLQNCDTGGGLTAWRFDLNSGNHVLVTYYDGDTYGPMDEASWMAGLYDSDGDQIHCDDGMTFDDAITQLLAWRNEGR